MLRLARQFTPSTAVAEEVVQETWLAVLDGIDRFEGRSSLKTWVLRILVNRAKTRGTRERRTVPFAALAGEESGGDFHAVAADRFLTEGREVPPPLGGPLPRWEAQPEGALESAETLALIREAIDELPPAQRTVILLRDVEGWDGPQVSNALDITETNQTSPAAPRALQGARGARGRPRPGHMTDDTEHRARSPRCPARTWSRS